MTKVLVTGADGFIGSHLVEMLTVRGYTVRALCMYNSLGSWGWLDSLSSEFKESIEVVLGDVRDGICVKEAMQGCEVVFHLAALIAIPYSYVAPKSYIDTNIHGTLNVVQAARELGSVTVIHTSTSETYGSAQFVPITEQHPLVGQSPYAASKIGADQLALSYWRSFQTPVTIVRPFNTYGPRQSSRAVIPTIISQIASGKNSIRLGSLTPTRDFNFVSDTCNAFIAAAETVCARGMVLNSASGFEISIGETVRLIASLMMKEIVIESEEARLRPESSEVNRLYGDSQLLRRVTSWRPEYGGLEGFKRGLKNTIEWFCKEENMKRYSPDRYTI